MRVIPAFTLGLLMAGCAASEAGQGDPSWAGDPSSIHQLNGASGKTIPYDGVMRYPDNWPDLVELRSRSGLREHED
jgi:hypothetical protein